MTVASQRRTITELVGRVPRRRRISRRAKRRLESRIVWLLGSPRSGSSWLVSMLAAGRRAIALDEPTIGLHLGVLMMDFVSVRPHRVAPEQLRVNEVRSELDSYFFSRRYEPVWRPLVRDLLLGRIDAEARDIARVAGVRSPQVLIKEPIGSQAADILLDATPRARMIFLLRDGRDVVDSELDAFAGGGWMAEQLPDFQASEDDRLAFLNARAHAWLARTEVVQRAFAAHPPELRRLIRYEDLLERTEETVGDLDAWLGLGLSEGAIPELVDRLSFDRLDESARGPGRFARAARPGLWRQNLSESEQDLLEGVIGGKLRELGYE